MATKKKFVVTDGPALFDGIVCRYWFFPYEHTFSALRFELKGKKDLFAHIFGMFPAGEHSKPTEQVILFGQACGKELGGDYFVMHINKRTRKGTIEVIDPLTCDNKLLLTHFPQIFKKPEPPPENPVLSYLRAMPWEKKMELANDFTKDMLQRRVDTTMAKRFILELFVRADRPDKQVSTEIEQNQDFDIDRLADVFCQVCPLVTNFFHELGMKYFLTHGGKMSAHKPDSVIISLGPKETIDFD